MVPDTRYFNVNQVIPPNYELFRHSFSPANPETILVHAFIFLSYEVFSTCTSDSC